jgi:hypothetical protein
LQFRQKSSDRRDKQKAEVLGTGRSQGALPADKRIEINAYCIQMDRIERASDDAVEIKDQGHHEARDRQ